MAFPVLCSKSQSVTNALNRRTTNPFDYVESSLVLNIEIGCTRKNSYERSLRARDELGRVGVKRLRGIAEANSELFFESGEGLESVSSL